MTLEQLPAAPPKGVWTPSRIVLALAALALLTLASAPGCNPTDSSANANAAGGNANAHAANANPPGTPAANGAPVPMPDDVKNAELKTLDGETFKLSDFGGKIVVVNLWATWCGPCRQEIPQIVALRKAYEGKDVEFIGLTFADDRGNTPEAVREFVAQQAITYRIAWADQKLYARLLAPGYQIPQTYIIDKQGRIRKKIVGGGAHVGEFIRATLDDILADKQG
jgi:thiol-disulfide isomerase/thioredoxin